MAMTDAEAYEAILNHHEALEAGLARRVEALRAASASAEGFPAAKAAVLDYIADELLPHALAEESSIYPAAAVLPGQGALVAGMIMEHRALGAGVELLAHADAAAEAVAYAEAIDVLFSAHAAKENELILPEIRAAGAGRLAALLGEMHAHLTGAETATSREDAAAVEPELDVRTLAPAVRHTTIFATFDGLRPGGGFLLINDHDPKPLRYQFEAEHAGEFTWDYIESGPRTWQVRIGRPLVHAAV